MIVFRCDRLWRTGNDTLQGVFRLIHIRCQAHFQVPVAPSLIRNLGTETLDNALGAGRADNTPTSIEAIERFLNTLDDDGRPGFTVTPEMLNLAVSKLPPKFPDAAISVGRVMHAWTGGDGEGFQSYVRYIKQDPDVLADLGGEAGLYDVWANADELDVAEAQTELEIMLSLAVTAAHLGTTDAPAQPPPRSYTARRVSDVEAKPVKWLWQDRIAQGKITLVGGPPKRGKSQLTCALAAPVTRGGTFPDGSAAPIGSVAIITCEDDLADTIKPRLLAAGADVEKVHVFDMARVRCKDGKIRARAFNVADHMPQLTEFIADIGDLKLLVIDPILAYMGRADSHKTSDVRGAMLGLQQLVADREIAAVLITHLNKNDGGQSAMNRMAASGAFTAVARGVWLVDFDPTDSDRERRLFVPIGANIGNDREGFAFRIETVWLPGGIVTSKVVFEDEPIKVDADEIMGPRDPAQKAAREFLQLELADGPKPIREMNKAAKEVGIHPKTLSRAAEKMAKRVLHEGKSCWRLDPTSVRGTALKVLDGSCDAAALFE